MDLSVVIVNWNTRDILRNCLSSVYAQTKNVDFEVIVVDNASEDGSAAMVNTEFSQVILVRNEMNRGFAAANNQGIVMAKGRYVLLLNSDTIVLDNAIEKVVQYADSEPDAAVVGCRVLNPDRTLQPTCFMFPSILNMFLSSTYLYKIFPRSRFFGRERMTWWDRNDVRQVNVVTGCFMLVCREAIEQVGMMDEQFFMYGEETDWCYRFKKAGWKAMFTPAAQIIHLGGQSSRLVRAAMVTQLRMSILKVVKKHCGRPTYCSAVLMVVMFFVLRIPYWYVRAFIESAQREQLILRARTYWQSVTKILFS